MEKIYFKVTLLSDIILNQKAATEGPNSTLDFIPGNNFLGIVASKIYGEIDKCINNNDTQKAEKLKVIALEMFHSGKVIYNDAHLGIGNNRSNKVPAAFYYPKLKKPSEVLYVSHCIPQDEEFQKGLRNEQPKQCRNGFYDLTGNEFSSIEAKKSFAIKSAHDRTTRASKKSQMFGYQSITKGATMYFSVESDSDKYFTLIKSLLTGEKRIGRSRSAQYGLVWIESTEKYDEVNSCSKNGTITIYADSRLIFIDEETGMVTFHPTIKQLGLESGNINWSKSQIRTFQYSPWNFHRQCFDTDRCGIEKGSVFVIDNVTGCPDETSYVGSYINEGFGRVIYNPSFLDGDNATGLALGKIMEQDKDKNDDEDKDFEVENIYDDDSTLIKRLKQRHFEEEDELEVYNLVNDWINENKKLFTGKSKETFASQWGTIRSIAMQFDSRNKINDELFHKTRLNNKKKDKKGMPTREPYAYLTHGVAKDKWNKDRREALLKFCAKDLEKFNDKYFRFAVINLAAEMAKRCRKESLR